METARTRTSGCRVRGIRLAGAAILALLISEFSASADAQPYCRVEYTTWNADRHVFGAVDAECQAGFHDPALGRWGVRTESARKTDGDPFEGWCRNAVVQDPEDDSPSRTVCTGGGYEWNSCASHSQSPPSRAIHSHNNYQQPKSTTSRSVDHGGGFVWMRVQCPTDTNRDGTLDSGGCGDVLTDDFTVSGHRMELHRLAPGFHDSHVDTLRFPDLVVSTSDMRCDPEGCTGGAYGDWEPPEPRPVPAASAQVTAQVTSALFVDPYGQCSGE